ncbi:MAG: hypothetical protein Kow0077_08160 [Anaerolineae bacterium]
MTDRHPSHPDPEQFAELLEALLASSDARRQMAEDPALEAARLLVNAPRPVFRPEAQAQLEAQVLAAAEQMRWAPARPRFLTRLSWPLAAAAALVFVLAVVLGPGQRDQAAAPSPTATDTATATPSPTLSPTFTLEAPGLLAVTEEALPTETETPTPTPTETPVSVPAGAGEGQPGEEYDCTNPPPEDAPALGWRKHCQDGADPNTVIPGQQGRPGNSGSAPGQNKPK